MLVKTVSMQLPLTQFKIKRGEIYIINKGFCYNWLHHASLPPVPLCHVLFSNLPVQLGSAEWAQLLAWNWDLLLSCKPQCQELLQERCFNDSVVFALGLQSSWPTNPRVAMLSPEGSVWCLHFEAAFQQQIQSSFIRVCITEMSNATKMCQQKWDVNTSIWQVLTCLITQLQSHNVRKAQNYRSRHIPTAAEWTHHVGLP